jgi:hypothetical protein
LVEPYRPGNLHNRIPLPASGALEIPPPNHGSEAPGATVKDMSQRKTKVGYKLLISQASAGTATPGKKNFCDAARELHICNPSLSPGSVIILGVQDLDALRIKIKCDKQNQLNSFF